MVMVYTKLLLLKQIANCKSKIFQPNLLMRQIPNKWTIFAYLPTHQEISQKSLHIHGISKKVLAQLTFLF